MLYEDFQVNNSLIERPPSGAEGCSRVRGQSGGRWEEGQELGAREGRKEMCIKSLSDYENNGKKPLFFSLILPCQGVWAALQPVISREKLVCSIPARYWSLSHCSLHTKSLPPLLALHLCFVGSPSSLLPSVSSHPSHSLLLLPRSGWCLLTSRPLASPFPQKGFLQVHLNNCFVLLASLSQTLSPNFSFTLLEIVRSRSHHTWHGSGIQKLGHEPCMKCGEDLPHPMLSDRASNPLLHSAWLWLSPLR